MAGLDERQKIGDFEQNLLFKVVKPRGLSGRGYFSSAGPQLSSPLRADSQATEMAPKEGYGVFDQNSSPRAKLGGSCFPDLKRIVIANHKFIDTKTKIKAGRKRNEEVALLLACVFQN